MAAESEPPDKVVVSSATKRIEGFMAVDMLYFIVRFALKEAVYGPHFHCVRIYHNVFSIDCKWVNQDTCTSQILSSTLISSRYRIT